MGGVWPQVGAVVDVLQDDGTWEEGLTVKRRFNAVKRAEFPLIPASCLVDRNPERLRFSKIRPSLAQDDMHDDDENLDEAKGGAKYEDLLGAKIVKCERTRGIVTNVCTKTNLVHVVYETNEDADIELSRAEELTLVTGGRKPPTECLFKEEDSDHPPRTIQETNPTYIDVSAYEPGDTIEYAWSDLKEYQGRIVSIKKSV